MGKRGPKKLSLAELEARGSWLAPARRKKALLAKQTKARKSLLEVPERDKPMSVGKNFSFYSHLHVYVLCVGSDYRVFDSDLEAAKKGMKACWSQLMHSAFSLQAQLWPGTLPMAFYLFDERCPERMRLNFGDKRPEPSTEAENIAELKRLGVLGDKEYV